MSKAQQARERRAKQAAGAAAARRRDRRRTVVVIAVVAALAVAALVAVTSLRPSGEAATEPPEGVEQVEVASADHVEGRIDYERDPPAGGPHNPVWQNCGFYDQPVRDEHAVHSMEHGAVWITYRPDLEAEAVEGLDELAGRRYVLVSPRDDLPAPVVASAWGHQLAVDNVDDPRVAQFVRAYAQGPQTPEPGAPCSGGVGEPR